MHPLLLEGLMPDSLQVSRDAARRHAILTARKKSEHAPRRRFRAWRPALQI